MIGEGGSGRRTIESHKLFDCLAVAPRSEKIQNQHYVPQFLLRNFCLGQQEQICVFDKHTNRSFKTNIRNIASEKGFYDFQPSKDFFSFERSLSTIESLSKNIVDQILIDRSIANVSEKEMAILSLFTAIQFARSRQFREMVKGSNEQIAQKIRRMGHDPNEVENFEEFDEESLKLFANHFMFASAPEIALHIADKTWVTRWHLGGVLKEGNASFGIATAARADCILADGKLRR